MWKCCFHGEIPGMGQLRGEMNHTLVVAHGVYREECFSVSPNFQ
jgi:hypothetical protein